MSGLSRTPGKRVWANPHRGFESRPLRQKSKKRPSGRFFRFDLSSDTERFQRLLPASRNAGGGGAQPADLLQNV